VKTHCFISIPRKKRQQTRVGKNRKRAEFNSTQPILVRWKLIRDDGMILDLVNDEATSRPIMLTSTDHKDVAIGPLRAAPKTSTIGSSGSPRADSGRLV
jgi:hypothetical protein